MISTAVQPSTSGKRLRQKHTHTYKHTKVSLWLCFLCLSQCRFFFLFFFFFEVELLTPCSECCSLAHSTAPSHTPPHGCPWRGYPWPSSASAPVPKRPTPRAPAEQLVKRQRDDASLLFTLILPSSLPSPFQMSTAQATPFPWLATASYRAFGIRMRTLIKHILVRLTHEISIYSLHFSSIRCIIVINAVISKHSRFSGLIFLGKHQLPFA